MTELFEFWLREPEQLPESYLAEIESEGAARVAADYIAGMTDQLHPSAVCGGAEICSLRTERGSCRVRARASEGVSARFIA